MSITIGLQLAPMHGDLKVMQKAWMEAEAMGADCLYTADHFNAMVLDQDQALRQTHDGDYGKSTVGACYEATTIQMAMAMTTSRARVGCIVHGNNFRNPNLMADIGRMVDLFSDGRFILGLGTGYLRGDYEDYGYEFGTQTSRANDLARDIPIIKQRLGKLSPPPIGKLPILIATMGEKIGMRIAAEHADMWHVYGTTETVIQKLDAMRRICKEVGRDFSDLELVTNYNPQLTGGTDPDPDLCLKLGIRHIVLLAQGPTWDLGQLREILEWKKSADNGISA